MRIIASFVAVLLVAGLAAAFGAEAHQLRNHKRQHVQHYPRTHSYDANHSGYYEHWAAKLPFGSSTWWEQMVREDRVRR